MEATTSPVENPPSVSIVDSIASQVGCPPEYVVRTGDHDAIAARWRHPASFAEIPNLDVATLIFHLGGSTDVERWKPSIRARIRGSRVGTVTLLRPHEETSWHVRGEVDVLHVYMPERVLCESEGIRLPLTFRDVFSEKDVWLTSFGNLILQYIESQPLAGYPVDSLLLEQMRDSLARYIRLNYHEGGHTSAVPLTESQKPLRLSPATVKKVLDWMNENFSRDIRVRDMAEIACLSETYFLKAFRDTVGKTPYRYLQKIRLDAARIYLRTTLMPVASVALACGFRSTSHFCVEFSRDAGVSPGRFRKTLD
ncbi:AraC family transcriptional regulator [Paraburkholderia sediminicola]|uniref:AraC family transcriptional regulator n=1 Tax=Paraburkholderia metrosideri TaxID=580937 RepID=A0ABW9E341_9BURK